METNNTCVMSKEQFVNRFKRDMELRNRKNSVNIETYMNERNMRCKRKNPWKAMKA